MGKNATNFKKRSESKLLQINEKFREPIKRLAALWAIDAQKALYRDKFELFGDLNKEGNYGDTFIIFNKQENGRIEDGELKSDVKEYLIEPEIFWNCLMNVFGTFNACGIPPQGNGRYITK